ncbi:MAG: UDP-3-O-(3-hydroxymyristoyl)glucosamine N-acyltransferase [Methylotenera sp.]|nr:UDP-3-O-(3-hydroxymyristoyl)glucosamine N-acyltransferase [Oligoflexia bacterium]
MSFSVAQIAEWTQGQIVNANAILGAEQTLSGILVSRLAPLAGSQKDQLAFFFNKEYQHELPSAHPGILITGELFVKPLEAAGLPFWKSTAVIACEDPYSAMALLSAKFAEVLSSVGHQNRVHKGVPKIHPTAVVHSTAQLGAGVEVGPHCTIDENVKIGAGSLLYSGCTLGPSVNLGEDCVLFPRVTLYEWTQLGNRVRLHAGCVLGADGFGYAPILSAGPSGRQVSGHQKIYHLGRVVVGDDVEMGANTLVDRSTLGDTVIGKNAKLDNHVHVGHNAQVGEGAILCGGVFLAGSASVGKYVYVGGMSGITNKIHVGDGAKVGAMTLVTKDVPPGLTAVGNPQREHSDHFRAHATLNRLSSRDSRSSKKANSKKGNSSGTETAT